MGSTVASVQRCQFAISSSLLFCVLHQPPYYFRISGMLNDVFVAGLPGLAGLQFINSGYILFSTAVWLLDPIFHGWSFYFCALRVYAQTDSDRRLVSIPSIGYVVIGVHVSSVECCC